MRDNAAKIASSLITIANSNSDAIAGLGAFIGAIADVAGSIGAILQVVSRPFHSSYTNAPAGFAASFEELLTKLDFRLACGLDRW